MQRMSRQEFIVLIAMMFATIAFSIDAMLPALPDIGAELSPDAPNRAQLVVTSFVLGMGIGTLFTGPLSDAFGRKPVIYGGVVLFIAGALIAWAADSLTMTLAGRVLQGLGAAAPRVVGIAIIRDLHSGRVMARILSIAMLIFTLVPAVAPLVGSWIIAAWGWHAIFLSFLFFGLLLASWTGLRLVEPLAPENRRPFRAPLMWDAARQMLTHPSSALSILVLSLCFGMMFTMLAMVQPLYDLVYDRADSFPLWYALVALVSGLASLFNAVLVVRVGMRPMIMGTLAFQIVLSGIVLALSYVTLPAPYDFAVFLIYQIGLFSMAGMTLGNLNAIAMEPMGHIAGMAASILGSVATVIASIIASLLGQMFDGTLRPLASGLLVMAIGAFLLMLRMRQLEARMINEACTVSATR